MKKLLMLILSVMMATSFMTGCASLKDDDKESGNSTPTTSEGGVSGEPEEKTYTITFKQDGHANVEKTVKEGEALTDIPEPASKTGYTITWDRTDFTNITSNITVTAIEKANKYTITYDANGGSVENATQEVTFDAETKLETPVKEDYKFLNWTYEGNAVVDGKWSIAGDVTLVASWQDVRPTYKVTFVDGTQSKVVEVKKGEDVAADDVPAFVGKTGYSVAWDKTDYTNIQSDITVTANYTANKYTITYDADGFAIDGTTVELTYDALCSALDMSLTSADSNFLGWKYGNATYTNESTWNIADNVTLTAEWEEKDQVTVTFKDTDGSSVNKTIYKGNDLTDIPTPTVKTGYTVDTENWYTDAECKNVATFTNVQEGFTVYAKATANTYTISYNANGGSVANATQGVTFDAAYTLATPTHEKSYMAFEGWKDAQGNTIAATGTWTIADGISLTAQWKDTRAIYTITFVQRGQETKTYTVKEGESLTDIPTPVAKTGYKVEWDHSDFTNISGNITVTAEETAKVYTATLKWYDGKTEIVCFEYNGAYEIKSKPTQTGYNFTGWTLNGVPFEEKGTWTFDMDAPIVIEAQWEKQPEESKDEWTGNY